MQHINSIIDYFHIKLYILELFKKHIVKIIPLCKIIFAQVKKYNELYHFFFLKKNTIINNIGELELFVGNNINSIDYNILQKIVYHQPKILRLRVIKLDKTLIGLAGSYFSTTLENRMNDLPLDLQLFILEQDPYMIKYIKYQYEDLCICALKKNPYALSYINQQYITDNVGLCALDKDIDNFKYILNPSNRICAEAVKIKPSLLDIVRYQSDDVCFAALDSDISSYKYIKYPSKAIKEYYCGKIKEFSTIQIH